MQCDNPGEGDYTCSEGDYADCGTSFSDVAPPVPAPPPPVVVEVNAVVLIAGSESHTAAVNAIADAFALAASTEATSGAAAAAAEQPPVKISSSATFAVHPDQLPEGSQARTDFSTSFRTSMAGSFGGGNLIAPEKVVINAIGLSTRRRLQAIAGTTTVDFHIETPLAVADHAASMMLTLASSNETLSVSVGNETLGASSMASPVVTRTPDENCFGTWSNCTSTCSNKMYLISTTASGTGTACSAIHGATAACAFGDGDCRADDSDSTDDPCSFADDGLCDVPSSCAEGDFNDCDPTYDDPTEPGCSPVMVGDVAPGRGTFTDDDGETFETLGGEVATIGGVWCAHMTGEPEMEPVADTFGDGADVSDPTYDDPTGFGDGTDGSDPTYDDPSESEDRSNGEVYCEGGTFTSSDECNASDCCQWDGACYSAVGAGACPGHEDGGATSFGDGADGSDPTYGYPEMEPDMDSDDPCQYAQYLCYWDGDPCQYANDGWVRHPPTQRGNGQ